MEQSSNNKEKGRQEEESKKIYESIKKESDPSKRKRLIMINILDEKCDKIQDEYSEKSNGLENEYMRKYLDVNKQIQEIVEGSNPQLTEEELNNYKITNDESSNKEVQIEDYWYKVLINSAYFDIAEKDEPILKKLKKVFITKDDEKSMNYTVHFYFGENEFFNEFELTKKYFLDSEGEVKCTKGTSINWKSDDVNPTRKKKAVKKGNKKNKKKANKKEDDGYESTKSFFNLFKEEFNHEIAVASDENVFFKQDLFVNQLEYYLDIMNSKKYGLDDDDFEEDMEDQENPNKKKKGGNKKKDECKGQ